MKLSPTPTPEQAAAITAAVERFLAETAPAPGGDGEGIGPWQRAALLEGVGAKQIVQDQEGGERWLS